MSQLQRVIPLNKPFKLRGYTIGQWLILGLSLAVAMLVGSKVPGDWKLDKIPVGFLVGLLIFCLAIVFVSATQMHPLIWWRNQLLYKLGLAPRLVLPSRDPPLPYIDATIVEVSKKGDDQPYVTFEQ